MPSIRISYVGVAEAGEGLLLGGVKVHRSAHFETQAMAESWLSAVKRGNKEADRDVAALRVVQDSCMTEELILEKEPWGEFRGA